MENHVYAERDQLAAQVQKLQAEIAELRAALEGKRPSREALDGDVVVNLGDMSTSLPEKVTLDEDFEAMVEDYIGTFNNIIIQGVTPMKALLSFASALAVTLGCCVRAGLKPSVGGKLVGMIVKNAEAHAKSVRITTDTRKVQ